MTTISSSFRPRLRWPIEVRLEQLGEDQALLIRCPLGYTEQPLLLVPAVAPIIQKFDGTRSIAELSTSFSHYGVTEDLILQIVELLDSHLFLDSPRYGSESTRIRLEFSAARERESALAGLSYPVQADQLKALINGYLVDPPKDEALPHKHANTPLVMISPHIDYQRGGGCYGLSYPALRSSESDLYIVIGTSHQYSPKMFHLTKKNFRTPLGTASCDQVFVNRIIQSESYSDSKDRDALFIDEYLHRKEHSLELQLPFLQTVAQHNYKISPILVGSFHRFLESNVYPEQDEEYDRFASALAQAIRATQADGLKIAIIAGVDMAHVGRYFGDKTSLTPAFMEQVALRDHEYLACIEGGDRRKLFDHIASDGDARKVCGFPTTYLLLDVLSRLSISFDYKLFNYSQAVNYHSDCGVTFAGAALYESDY